MKTISIRFAHGLPGRIPDARGDDFPTGGIRMVIIFCPHSFPPGMIAGKLNPCSAVFIRGQLSRHLGLRHEFENDNDGRGIQRQGGGQQNHGSSPDIVLMALNMPEMSGLEATPLVGKGWSKTKNHCADGV